MAGKRRSSYQTPQSVRASVLVRDARRLGDLLNVLHSQSSAASRGAVDVSCSKTLVNSTHDRCHCGRSKCRKVIGVFPDV